MKKVSMIVVAVLLLIVTACGSTSGTSSSNSSTSSGAAGSNNAGAAEGQTVTVGVITALTGGASGLGKSAGDAAELFRRELEQKGNQVGDYKMRILIKDYETNDTVAVTAAKQLISDDKAVIIAGSTQSSTTIATSQIASENKVPFLAIAPITTSLDYVYQLNFGNREVLNKAVEYLLDRNIRRVAWINARDAFGQDGLPYFEELAAETGIEIVAVEDFDASATDMTVQLTKIKQKNPEALIVWSRQPGANVVAKNFKQLGFDIPMIQSHAAASDSFKDSLGAEGEGILVIGGKISVYDQLPAEEREHYRKYAEDFFNAFGYPADFPSSHMYDALHIMAKAIEAGNTTPEEINDWLKNGGLGEFKGLYATFGYKNGTFGADDSGIALLEIHAETDGKTIYRYVQ